MFSDLTGATQTVTVPGGFQIVDTPINSTNSLIVVPPMLTTSVFSYTRRADPSVTYSIWTSTNLTTWTRDTGAVVGTITATNGIETVPVTLSQALLANPKLFVRVQAQ